MNLTHDDLVHIDIETRSHINLPNQGVYVYADSRWTDILFVCYAKGADKVKSWIPWLEPMPDDLRAYFEDPEQMLAAHNASFERLLFNRVGAVKYGVPVLEPERWFCTLYQMSVNNIPESLENAGRALHSKAQKSQRGKALIRMLCLPDENGKFLEDVSLYKEFWDYCKQDVETERAISHMARLPTEDEMEDYWVCERVNDVGVKIDRALAAKAVTLVDQIAAEAETTMAKLTNNEIKKARGAKLTAWIYDRLPVEGQKRMTKQVKDKKTNEFVNKITLDANAREALLNWPDLVGLEREVVELAESVGSGSVAKFASMMRSANEDDRVRGSYSCSGAPATGRYSARRMQIHNFSRDTYADPEPIIQTFLETGELPDSPMLALKRLLRPALMAEKGKVFVTSDWSAIEGRALPWLTDSPKCESKLNLFRRDECVYLATASDIYREPVTEKSDPRRQVGKVAELALGFQGAVGSFKTMGNNYGIYLPEDEIKQIVASWRSVNPGIVEFWGRLENAALRAVDQPNTMHPAGRVNFLFNESILGGVLWCRLPSGRMLSYTNCRIEYNEEWHKYFLTSLNASVNPKAGATEWTRRGLYGGLFAENVTQATCADLLREAVRALVRDDYPVVAHTHDEVVLEVPEADADAYLEALESYMLFVPPWAERLPLAVESWVGPRYKK